jgi:integrase
MPATNLLTDKAIREKHLPAAQAAGKPIKATDGDGMYLLARPNGAAWWRLDYRRPDGSRNTLSLGTYPETTLALARSKRTDARAQLAAGIDPSDARKAGAKAEHATFEVVAREWYAKFAPTWAPTHADKIIRRLERDAFPWIGRRPIRELTPPDLLAVLRRVEARDCLDTAHRVHQNCSQVFRYAVATGQAERDPAGDLRGALPPPQRKHYATITEPAAVGALLRAIDGYKGSLVVAAALRLAPLVFVRPGELRKAQWAEFNLDGAEWRIPAERMKARVQHVVPLSAQAVAILRDLAPLTARGASVFPGRNHAKWISENTLNAALRRLGYDGDQFTAHGFRAMASTTLNEQGWHRDAIERQLAHGERDKVRAAYNHAEHLTERRKMMQAWSDYLDGLRSRCNTVRMLRVV